MSDEKTPIEIARQALLELMHCVSAGPEWFTKGRQGQMTHALGWEKRGRDALDALSWQPIDEKTPQHGNYARISVEEGVLYCPMNGKATHWVPLPEPPEPENTA